MSQAGISDLSNREDLTAPEVPLREGEKSAAEDLGSSESPPSAEIPAATRFEQRIAPSGAELRPASEQMPRLKEADWFSLARKLRQRNRDLLKKVAELEQFLSQAREALQGEITRSGSFDALNRQQAQELEAARAKISSLYGELEASHQTAQQRDRRVEQLSKELEAASDRLAGLEQEYTLLGQHCHEQSHRAETAEQHNRELAVRLDCQQRRALQFKAALDKCLEAGAPESLQEEVVALVPPLAALEESTDLAAPLKTQPIQPWPSRDGKLTHCGDNLPEWVEKTRVEDEEAAPGPDSEPAFIVSGVEITDARQEPPLGRENEAATLETEPLEALRGTAFEPMEWEVEALENDPFDVVFEMFDDGSMPTGEGEASLHCESESEVSPRETQQLQEFSFERVLAVAAPNRANFPAPLVYPHRRERKHISLATIELPSFLR